MSDGLEVDGGVGGISASYDDMLTYARALEALADAVAARVDDVLAVTADADLIASTVLSPGTAAAVVAQVGVATAGPHGLAVAAARLTGAATALRASVAAYRAVDAAQAELTGWAQAVGAFPSLLAPAGTLTSGAGLALLDHDPVTAWQLLQMVPGATLDQVYAQPWIVDGVIKDAPALLWATGGATVLLGGPLGVTAVAGVAAWTSAAEGAPFPPTSLEEATATTLALGRLFGAMSPAPARAFAQSGPAAPPAGVRAPRNVESLLAGVAGLGREPGSVRIFSTTDAAGARRWVVELPGTQEWSPVAGENPVDLTNNLRLMAGQDTAQNIAIRDAMRQAGIRPGEQVLLAGHSQGGITAASLAADPATRAEFTITHVVTAGSPIARFDIPDTVDVLSIEHTRDAVPRLDGEPNPDRPNWVTVTRDVDGVPVDGSPVDGTGPTHHARVYIGTAALVDASGDPSLVEARTGLAGFLDTDPDTIRYQDFDLRRSVP